MSRVCEITWKKTGIWNKRSQRKFYPNLFYKNIKDPETGIVYRVKVSAKGLKTLRKKWIV